MEHIYGVSSLVPKENKYTCQFMCGVINLILCLRYGAQIELESHYVNRNFYVFLYQEIHRDPG